MALERSRIVDWLAALHAEMVECCISHDESSMPKAVVGHTGLIHVQDGLQEFRAVSSIAVVATNSNDVPGAVA
jgi:hypothetical protein